MFHVCYLSRELAYPGIEREVVNKIKAGFSKLCCKIFGGFLSNTLVNFNNFPETAYPGYLRQRLMKDF